MDKFIDREFSTLEFNARVLAEGMDPSSPLFERLKFVGIVSSNMDEFFMVRVASLKIADTDCSAVRQKARELLEKRNDYFLKTMVPELAAAGFVRLQPESCNPVQLEFLSQFFRKEILPVLTPIALSEERPLPGLANLRLYFVAGLKDPKGKESAKYAVVEIPAKLFPRMIFLPTEQKSPSAKATGGFGNKSAEAPGGSGEGEGMVGKRNPAANVSDPWHQDRGLAPVTLCRAEQKG